MWNWNEKLSELKKQNRECAIVTVVDVAGSAPREAGAKMIVLNDGTFFGTIGGGKLEERAIADAVDCLKEKKAKLVKYPLGAATGQCCGGRVDLFMEVFNNGPRLYLFGAGHVGQAVARALIGTPFTVEIIDERDEWINAPELPAEAVRHHNSWDEIIDDIPWSDDKTFVAVMTHSHDVDQHIIENVISRPAKYIGLIGSQSKWRRFQERMKAKGTDEKLFARVRCPLGVPTGGKAPQEVAVSLACELLRIHYGN